MQYKRVSAPFDMSEAAAPLRTAGYPSLLVASLVIELSILYQAYFLDFNEGDFTGGGTQRLLLKIVGTLLFVVAVRRYLSIAVFFTNFALKIPLLFIAATILFIAPFLNAAYSQALNLLFFLPVLCIDWNRPGGTHLYKLIWSVIVVTVTVQLCLDPIFKVYFGMLWGNAAVIGGMGNPNVFGIFLIAAGLASAILLPSRFGYLSAIMFLSTILTGSAISALVGFTCAFLYAILLLIRSYRGIVLFTVIAIAIMSVSTIAVEFISESRAINHAFVKVLAVGDLLSGSDTSGTENISVRQDYTRRGLSMLGDSPLALITGHPNGIPMYSGDGMWLAMLVTYGLPITLYFLLINIVVINRAISSGSQDLRFSGCVIAVVMVFLLTNRILDYWPAALIYLLALSYLTTKGVRSKSWTRNATVEKRVVPRG